MLGSWNYNIWFDDLEERIIRCLKSNNKSFWRKYTDTQDQQEEE